MEIIRSFEDMVIHLAQKGVRKRVAIVWAADNYSQESVARALEVGFVEAIFVGCQKEVEANPKLMRYADHISFVEAADRDDAAHRSVAMVREGKADILMKGLINTDNLLHVVLNKETGILPRGNVLTHITAARLPEYESCCSSPTLPSFPTPRRSNASSKCATSRLFAIRLASTNQRFRSSIAPRR